MLRRRDTRWAGDMRSTDFRLETPLPCMLSWTCTGNDTMISTFPELANIGTAKPTSLQ